jgi:ferredoxin-NADP reductase
MLRARCQEEVRPPVHVLYAVRDPESVLYKEELAIPMDGVEIVYVYSRVTPPEWPRAAGRLTDADLMVEGFGPGADVYVCGPSAFVESVADRLVRAGHAAEHVRTERFG